MIIGVKGAECNSIPEDVRTTDQGCKDIPTPNIDALAKKGVRFTNGYVSGPSCSPTRAGMLTGRDGAL
jgi:arylsulfatase A-like enzyme